MTEFTFEREMETISCKEAHPDTPACDWVHQKPLADHYFIDGVEVTREEYECRGNEVLDAMRESRG